MLQQEGFFSLFFHTKQTQRGGPGQGISPESLVSPHWHGSHPGCHFASLTPREGGRDQADRGSRRWGAKMLKTHLAQSQTVLLLHFQWHTPSSFLFYFYVPSDTFGVSMWTFTLYDLSNLFILGINLENIYFKAIGLWCYFMQLAQF